jgi:hypothetical protein
MYHKFKEQLTGIVFAVIFTDRQLFLINYK